MSASVTALTPVILALPVLSQCPQAKVWIVEGAFGHLPRGRKPRFLHLNVDRAGIIGVNVRASVTEIGLANLDARFISQESFATPPDFEDFTSTLTQRLRALIDLHPQMFWPASASAFREE